MHLSRREWHFRQSGGDYPLAYERKGRLFALTDFLWKGSATE